MTTFQTIVYAVVSGMTEFLPMSTKAHQTLIPFLIGWQTPPIELMGALSLGSFLALLIYFRHDWASMISCFLQVIIFRKRPMTLDERLPLFICLSTLPIAIASSYFGEHFLDVEWSPVVIAAVFATTGLPLWAFDYFNRKSKGMFDWNWLDAFFVGITQASAVIPGCDHMTGILLGAFFLNYKRETATKYAYFASAPLLLVQIVKGLKTVSFHTSSPAIDLSWLSFGVAIVVTLLVGLLAIGGFIKHVQQKGLGQYVIYRWILALGVCVVYWFRNHR